MPPIGDTVIVPPGLVKTRKAFGIPLVVFVGIGLSLFLPLWSWGLKTWWVAGINLLIGVYIASEAKKDPKFIKAWVGELLLKKRYF